ncbi:MAG: tolB protein precursor protein, partial [Actinomycetia bacterium]|nr:tolB protein precursor protein [Actinomycetes bacterium]
MRRGAILAASVLCALLYAPAAAWAFPGAPVVLAPAGAVPGPFPSPVAGQFGDASPNSLLLYNNQGVAQAVVIWAKHQNFGSGDDRFALGIDVQLNTTTTQTLNVYFDNNNDGVYGANDDALTITRTPSGSVSVSDAYSDAAGNLTLDPVDSDVAGAVETTGQPGHLFFALSHRLCSGDSFDICVSTGMQVGMAVTITGNDGSSWTSVPGGSLQRRDLWPNLLAGNVPTYASGGSVSGSSTIGSTATVTDFGTWAAAPPASFQVQWQRCAGATCTDIPSATGGSYVVAAADAGYSLRARIRATNVFGTGGSLGLPLNNGVPVARPPVNGAIYFERAHASPFPDNQGEIWTMAADGSGQRRFSTLPAATNGGISIAPDGHTVAYTAVDLAAFTTRVAIQDGETTRFLLPFTLYSFAPAWSHDGQWIAFSADHGGHIEIALAHPDGSGFHWLAGSDPGANGALLSWSPDDAKIVYATDGPNQTLSVIAAAGGLVTRIGPGFGPRWGPTGEIAYSLWNGSQYKLHVFDPRTQSDRPLLNSNTTDVVAGWSPDGTKILFSSDRNEPSGSSTPGPYATRGLWVVTASGSGSALAYPVAANTWDMYAAWATQPVYTATSGQRPPIPDGRVTNDYPGAIPIPLDLNFGPGPAHGYVTRVAGRLYFAFAVPDMSPNGGMLRVQFDSNHDGTFDTGDDVIGLDADGTMHDESFAGYATVADLQNDVTGAAGWASNIATYELSIPLCSGDAQDVCLHTGENVPFEVSYVGGDSVTGTHAPAADPYAVDQYAILRVPPWQDVTGPSLVSSTLMDGALLHGVSTPQVEFEDVSGLSSVSVRIDGQPSGIVALGVTTASLVNFDSSSLPDGLHTITWDAVDSLGNHATYDVKVIVVNQPPAVT